MSAPNRLCISMLLLLIALFSSQSTFAFKEYGSGKWVKQIDYRCNDDGYEGSIPYLFNATLQRAISGAESQCKMFSGNLGATILRIYYHEGWSD